MSDPHQPEHQVDLLARLARSPAAAPAPIVGPRLLDVDEPRGPFGLTLGSKVKLKPLLGTALAWERHRRWGRTAALQAARRFPAGTHDVVMRLAGKFIIERESVESTAYVPGLASGVTIGVGYDLSQVREQEFRADWAELDKVVRPPAVHLAPPPSFHSSFEGARGVDARDLPSTFSILPKESMLLTRLDRLAVATHGRMDHEQALAYVKELRDIWIPPELSIRIFEDRTMPKIFKQMCRAWPGAELLPTGVQVALLSLIYNRGPSMGQGAEVADDLYRSRWEMSALIPAVAERDIVAIHWMFESMRRVWANSKDRDAPGLVKRRNMEIAWIAPYVQDDLAFEAAVMLLDGG